MLVCRESARANEAPITQRTGLGFEIGNWQPHSLNDEPKFTDFGAAGATPFYCLSLTLPIKKDMGIRISTGYWTLRDLKKTENVHSLILYSLCLDSKLLLIPNYRLGAYVMYGGGIYWGVENETTPFGKRIEAAIPGWGANLGTGIDLALSRGLGLGLIFQYHLVRFKQSLGGVSDFSGPKVGVIVYWYF
jgi:hypothetical protein